MSNENQKQHVKTLTRLLDQLSGLNVNEDSRGRLEAALRAAVEALEGVAEPEQGETRPTAKTGGIDLSDDVNDHLARIAQKLPTRDQERRTSAVNTLVSLTMNMPVDTDHDQAAKDLANLLLRTER